MSYGSRKKPAQAYPYCKRGQRNDMPLFNTLNEKAFPRMIRSQDTCSVQKADDSWVRELAFFIDVFMPLPFYDRGRAFLYSKT